MVIYGYLWLFMVVYGYLFSAYSMVNGYSMVVESGYLI